MRANNFKDIAGGTDTITEQINELKMHAAQVLQTDDDILQDIREICKGLALSDRARAARYDKIVEVLNGRD